ncbi:hypothetical protein GCM10027162_67130 [Streptomyces incanus]
MPGQYEAITPYVDRRSARQALRRTRATHTQEKREAQVKGLESVCRSRSGAAAPPGPERPGPGAVGWHGGAGPVSGAGQPKRSIRMRSTGCPAATSSLEACSAKELEPHT